MPHQKCGIFLVNTIMITNRANITFGDLKIDTNLSSYYSSQYSSETTTPLIVRNGRCYYISSSGHETEF